jgi:hypothetical protein
LGHNPWHPIDGSEEIVFSKSYFRLVIIMIGEDNKKEK